MTDCEKAPDAFSFVTGTSAGADAAQHSKEAKTAKPPRNLRRKGGVECALVMVSELVLGPEQGDNAPLGRSSWGE